MEGRALSEKPVIAAEEVARLAQLLREELPSVVPGLSLTDEQVEAMGRYLVWMREKNKVMNLTGITDDAGMVRRHLIDSLALLLAGELRGTLVDVGTGAGLPGVPVALACPSLKVTLLDSLRKRIDFLAEVCHEVPVGNAEPVWGRAEELSRGKLRARFDVATARAVARLGILAELCLPYVKVGGLFLPMKGGEIEGELAEAEKALSLLGGQVERVIRYTLPGEGEQMALPVIRKVRETPSRFPRRFAQMKKEGL